MNKPHPCLIGPLQNSFCETPQLMMLHRKGCINNCISLVPIQSEVVWCVYYAVDVAKAITTFVTMDAIRIGVVQTTGPTIKDFVKVV